MLCVHQNCAEKSIHHSRVNKTPTGNTSLPTRFAWFTTGNHALRFTGAAASQSVYKMCSLPAYKGDLKEEMCFGGFFCHLKSLYISEAIVLHVQNLSERHLRIHQALRLLHMLTLHEVFHTLSSDPAWGPNYRNTCEKFTVWKQPWTFSRDFLFQLAWT